MKDPHNVEVKFVNELSNYGFLNGNINLTLGTAQFTPNGDGKVDADIIVGARLRMDLVVAQQLHAALGKLIEQNTKPAEPLNS